MLDLNNLNFSGLAIIPKSLKSNSPAHHYTSSRKHEIFATKRDRMESLIARHGGRKNVIEKDLNYRKTYGSKWSAKLRRYYLGFTNTEYKIYVLENENP